MLGRVGVLSLKIHTDHGRLAPTADRADSLSGIRVREGVLERDGGTQLSSTVPKTSVFEQIPKQEWVAENRLTFAIRDAHPASPGHSLVVPKRPIVSWFDATTEEVLAMTELVALVKRHLDVTYHPAGYNVGFNDGAAAGQTVFHAHLHVIPRFDGDVPTPAGGVRHAMTGSGSYGTGAR